MIDIRRSEDRGHANHGWLDTYHSFSFADYHDPDHMGYSVLRVINDDRIAPAGGFGTHPHRNMEIITYVLSGALEHKDSMGNGSIIRAGDVQRMSAGSGVTHSEFNASTEEPVHLLQIWILPERTGLPPSYAQIAVPAREKRGALRLVAGGDGTDTAVSINQDAKIYASLLEAGEQVTHTPGAKRRTWIQVARGALSVNGVGLETGDGAAIVDEPHIDIGTDRTTEFLLFDLPD